MKYNMYYAKFNHFQLNELLKYEKIDEFNIRLHLIKMIVAFIS